MTTYDGGQPVVVLVGECRCPGTPHTTDSVSLAPEPSLSLGLAANGAFAAAGGDAAALEPLLGRVFIEHGIVAWTFTDEDGPVPITPANIERLLPWLHGGSDVAERAAELYAEAIIRPLLTRSLNSSPRGRTNGSTSAIPRSPRGPRSSSKSSSPAPSVTRP